MKDSFLSLSDRKESFIAVGAASEIHQKASSPGNVWPGRHLLI